MQIANLISNLCIPAIVVLVVVCGLVKKVPVYECFTDGAKEGLQTVVGILPTLVGLMTAVGVLRASGLLDLIASGLGKVTGSLHIPGPVVPVILVRMFSSSAATGLVLDLFQKYGPDSGVGRLTSVLMSCTETIFYTMSVYFLAAKVKKTRWTTAGALFAMCVGIAASVVLTM